MSLKLAQPSVTIAAIALSMIISDGHAFCKYTKIA
jgi:hypothetical protein